MADLFVIGIDPGATGALAIYGEPGGFMQLQTFDLPSHKIKIGKTERQRVDPWGTALLLGGARAQGLMKAFLEKQQPGPKDGGRQGYGLGLAYGILYGQLASLGYEIEPVPPAVWKRRCRVPGKAKHEAGIMPRAREMFGDLAAQFYEPHANGSGKYRVRVDRAEAAMIARYGYKSIHGGTP